MADSEVQQRVKIALAQAKSTEREAHKTVVLLAQLRDHNDLQSDEPAQGEENAPGIT